MPAPDDENENLAQGAANAALPSPSVIPTQQQGQQQQQQSGGGSDYSTNGWDWVATAAGMPTPDAAAAVGHGVSEGAKAVGGAASDAWDWTKGAAKTAGGWLGGAVDSVGGWLNDLGSAEQVSGPAQGQWGTPGTRADQYANAAGARGAQLSGQAGQMTGGLMQEGQAAAGRAAPTTDYSKADIYSGAGDISRNYAQQYTQNAADSAYQTRQLNALNNFANQAEGPSAAQAQLQAGSDAAQRSAMSMARSGRGAGDSAAALRDAAFNNATTQGTVAGQAAQLRAQETDAYRQRQLAALNAAMGGSTALRGSDAAAAQLAQGNRAQDLAAQQQAASQAQFGTQAGLQQTQLNDAARQGLYGTGLGYAQLGQSGELGYAQLGQNAYNSQADYELQQQQMALDAAKANQSADLEKDSGIIGTVGGLAAGAMSLFSDERLKKDIKAERALSRALGKEGGGGELETLGRAPAYSYRYKDPSMPGTAPGVQRSSMAQDLERGPHGDRVVTDTPQGKMVNYDEVVKLTPGALTELNQRLHALERSLGKRSAA